MYAIMLLQKNDWEVCMERAIGSSVSLVDLECSLAIEYNDCISDIYYDQKVQRLDDFEQHCHTSRLQHSLNVSYYSFLICRFFNWDYRSAARAGILHDLYFYDWRKPSALRGNHAAWHPRVALDNAKKITELNEIEEDAIIKHMWPCTLVPPKYKESYVVTFVDKTCAVFEVIDNLVSKLFKSK